MTGGGRIKTLTVRLDDELHRQFKIYSINHEKDMQQILIEHIEELLEEEKAEKK
ncbi:hypothetical protein LJC74_03815 [Eubacteriales bacterium OttesenSCG-928-A19]|nr:hypothetical protein [Eubacteriales bacterium OttesenSCG-928-A19]